MLESWKGKKIQLLLIEKKTRTNGLDWTGLNLGSFAIRARDEGTLGGYYICSYTISFHSMFLGEDRGEVDSRYSIYSETKGFKNLLYRLGFFCCGFDQHQHQPSCQVLSHGSLRLACIVVG